VNIDGESLPKPSSPDPGRPPPITETQQNRVACQIPAQSQQYSAKHATTQVSWKLPFRR
jgi:hypothetical protein